MPQRKKNPPIYVNSPNDPRYRAYQDSLNIHKIGEDIHEDAQKTGILTIGDINAKVKTDNYKHIPYSNYIDDWGGYKGEFSIYNYGTQQRMNPESIDVYSKPGLDFTKGFAARYKEPLQPIEVRQQSQHQITQPVKTLPKRNIQKLPTTSQSIQSQQMNPVQVLPMPHIQQKGWYSNSQNVGMNASDEVISDKLYNEDGTRKYQNGGIMNKKDKYPQVGPRDWMNQHGWYAEKGGYKPQQGVLPQIMPGMYPGNVPTVMNQHATEPVYMDVPAYAHGGFYQKPGYFYNGDHMVKNSGTGTYDNGTYFERGGYPVPAYGVGGNYDTSMQGMYTGNVPQSAAMSQVACQQYGGYADNDIDVMKKGGIHIKPENRGKFTTYKKRTGKTTEEALHSSDPHVRQMANFARNSAKWKHEQGGPVNPFNALRQYATGGPWGQGAFSESNPEVEQGRDAQERQVEQETGMQPMQETEMGQEQKPMVSSAYAAKPGEEGQMQDASGFDDPYSAPAEENTTTTGPKQPRQYRGLQVAEGIMGVGTGILGAASILHDRYQNRGVQKMWERDQNKSDNLPTYINPMSKGTYSQDGNIPYNNMSQSPNIRTMKTGGYVKGQEVELDEKQINELIRKGYKLQRL